MRLAALAAGLSLFLACGGGIGPSRPLAVSSVAPSTASSGARVEISGSGFRAGATVTVGGVQAEVLSVTDSLIAVTTPELSPGLRDIVVTNSDGERATLAGAFTVVAFAVTGIVPPRAAGAYTFTLLGSGLVAGTTVRFDGALPLVAFNTSFGMVGLLPPHDPGLVDVTVTSPWGRTLTLPNALTYVRPPVVTVTPATVTVGGSLTVSWVAEPNGPVDYIHPFREGADVGLDVLSIHVNVSSGSVTYAAPSSPGRYEFRYQPTEGQWGAVAAISNVVTVIPASLTPQR